MDTNALLVVIIALLSVNLLFVGIYIVLVLREVRTSVEKFNQILETANQVSSALATPIIGAAGTISAFTQGLKIFKKIKHKSKEEYE